jgi:phage-related protein
LTVGSALDDLRGFPEDVRAEMGYAIFLAQGGEKPPNAKPLRGFGGAGVLEVVSDRRGDTFRAVYTVRFRDAVYVLHAFQKKSMKGMRTPHRDIELIRERLKRARADHASRHKEV